MCPHINSVNRGMPVVIFSAVLDWIIYHNKFVSLPCWNGKITKSEFKDLIIFQLKKRAPTAARGSFNKALAVMRAGAKNLELRLTIMCVIIVMVFVGCNSFYVIYYILEG